MRWLWVVVLALSLAVPAPALAAHGDGPLININTADVETLDTLDGIGPSRAQDIIDYREANGPFATIEEISNVSGIGAPGSASYEKIKDHITVGEATGSNETATSTTQSTTQKTETTINTITQYQYQTVTIEPPQDVYLRVPQHITTTAGSYTQFIAESYDATGAAFTDGTVMWAFGDGAAGTGRVVSHQFAYAGEYTVTATLTRGGLTDQQHILVTVVPLSVILTVGTGGEWVAIENTSEHELNLSHWRITGNGQYFIIPEHTHIAPLQKVRFSTKITGLSFLRAKQEATLRFPDNSIAVEGVSESSEIEESTQVATATIATTTVATASIQQHSASAVIGTVVAQHYEPAHTSAIAELSAASADIASLAPTSQPAAVTLGIPKESGKNDIYWYLALGALLALAAGALLLLRPRKLIVEGFEVTEVQK